MLWEGVWKFLDRIVILLLKIVTAIKTQVCKIN